MIFGFGKKKQDDDSEDSGPDEEVELVLFRGALNGRDANLTENARLAQAGLIPAKEVVTDALLRRAESFRVDPKGNVAVVTIQIDGIPYPSGRIPSQKGLAITQMLKLLAGLDVRERRKQQVGGLKAELKDIKYELTVESAPVDGGGERLYVSAIDVKKRIETPEQIGMPDELKKKIREITSHKNGLILAASPRKSGTTTTVIGIVRAVDAYLYTIYSLADLGGRELSHVTNFEPEEGDDLAATMTRCVRAEADVIFLDPLRDAETAQTVFSYHKKVALVAEISAADPAAGILQMLKWIGDPEELVAGLKLAVGQKLIRLLCDKCKLAFRPNPKMVAKAGLPPETKVLYRATEWTETTEGAAESEPCPKCGGTGYLGRTAMFEAIEMTEPMQALLARNPSADAIRTQARRERMLSFRSEGMRLAGEGKTSIEELQRIFKAV